MQGQGKFDKFVETHPHPHQHFTRRPHMSRRSFFQIAGAGVTASFLADKIPAAETISEQTRPAPNRRPCRRKA